MSFEVEAKRTAVAEAYALWVTQVTGSRPQIVRTDNGRDVRLTPAQRQAMSASILKSMRKEPSPGDLNVRMPWADIMVPVVVKQFWPYIAGAVVVLGGIGYIAGKRR